MEHTLPQLASAIRGSLTDDLLKPQYREDRLGRPRRPFEGHCAVATQALYFLLGGEESDYKPMQVNHEGNSHWYLLAPNGQEIDLTAEQFATPVPYHKGKGKGVFDPSTGYGHSAAAKAR